MTIQANDTAARVGATAASTPGSETGGLPSTGLPGVTTGLSRTSQMGEC